MSYEDDLYATRQWYLSHEIMYIEPEGSNEMAERVVWENLILINASDPESAHKKALQHGADSEAEIRIDGQPARLKFKGLKDLVIVYDDLEDGAEIEWRECILSESELDRLLKKKEDFQAFSLRRKDD
jgi:hypothetical protein